MPSREKCKPEGLTFDSKGRTDTMRIKVLQGQGCPVHSVVPCLAWVLARDMGLHLMQSLGFK